MKTAILQLSKEERAILARLKAWLALQLAAEAFRRDAALREVCPAGGIALKLAIRGVGAGMQLVVKNGIARVYSVGWPQLVLFFPGSASAIRVLSGSKGTAVPLPLRPGAFKALGFFRKASSRATELLRGAETPEDVRARLLLAATLYGLEVVAGDSYLARRMQIIPDGVVAVRAGEIEYFVEKRGNAIHVIEAQRHPDAVLSFADYRSAIDVLSGKRQAVVALGSGEVRIEGLLPLVQGLFAVLDRLSWYLGVAL
ncbi:MAG: hypothetical protein ACYC1H_09260 [Rectinema subterraneum]|jgi:hypothetical protein